MSEMRNVPRITSQVRLTLSDVLPPDWGALDNELAKYADGGLTDATVLLPRSAAAPALLATIFGLASAFGRRGVAVHFERSSETPGVVR